MVKTNKWCDCRVLNMFLIRTPRIHYIRTTVADNTRLKHIKLRHNNFI